MYGSASTVRNGASDVMRVADLPVDERTAVGGQRVVEEEVEATEILERERQLVDRVGDRDPDLAGVGVDRVVCRCPTDS